MGNKYIHIGIVGAGAMGRGIAQEAAQNGHSVVLYDLSQDALDAAQNHLTGIWERLVQKGKMTSGEIEKYQENILTSTDINSFATCALVVEAVVENSEVKHSVFKDLEAVVSNECILATNTSSLSVTHIISALKEPSRGMGIHFFNPVPLMPLVEIVPGIQTNLALVNEMRALFTAWKKSPVVAKDTPGFIVNRIARPFYGESFKIYEEGIADPATIDWALTELGGFKMGPFTLTDYIGHDVNYVVTETVYKEMYFDKRYLPSLCQKKLVEANRLGRKNGHGFYDYSSDTRPEPTRNEELGEYIVFRVLTMLINEALDALYLGIASEQDIEQAMIKGVRYPKGLIAWCRELGADHVYEQLIHLRETYMDDRYRPSVLLRQMAEDQEILQ